MDPIILPLFCTAFGSTAGDILKKAAEKHVVTFFGKRLDDLAALGPQEKSAAQQAMEHAWGAAIEILLDHLRVNLGLEADEVAEAPEMEGYLYILQELMNDAAVAEQLMEPFYGDPEAPSASVLRDAWYRVGGVDLPPGFDWTRITNAYRRKVKKQRILNEDLRGSLQAEELVELRRLVQQQVGYQPEANLARYGERMRQKYRVLNLSAMRQPTTDEPGRPDLRAAFVPQSLRENPPSVELSEIPKDLLKRLKEEGTVVDGDLEAFDEHTAVRLQKLRESFQQNAPQPLLETVTAPENRKMVLIGEPGSGKSTLTRYLLLSVLEPPRNPETREPLAWTTPFEGHLPLLVELHDFNAVYRDNRCEDFLSYWHHLGVYDRQHLDQTWLDQRLQEGPSLVLFDGLDEIFDGRDRERVSHAIVGFAGAYPQARVLVTSRPVGYRARIFQDDDFRHYALEDLDSEQIETFVRGWFGLIFPDRDADAKQRIERVLGAVNRSKSVALLAGNPMLLTIMTMIAELRDLPRERWRFYDHAAEVLCHHWDVNRHLKAVGFTKDVGPEDKKDLLRRIASYMQAGEGGLAGNVVRGGELAEVMESFFENRYGLPRDQQITVAKEMLRQLRERNYILCQRGPNLYGFVHRTFLEYFCAAELARRVKEQVGGYSVEQLRDEVLATHWADEEWHEVLRLVCGMLGEGQAVRLLEWLFVEAEPDWREKKELPRSLVLALQCLAEVRVTVEVEDLMVRGVDAILDVCRLVANTSSWVGTSQNLPGISVASREISWPNHVSNKFTAEFEDAISGPEASVSFLFITHLASPHLRNRSVDELKRTIAKDSKALRAAAIHALAELHRNDVETFHFLRECAIQDKSAEVRNVAISVLFSLMSDQAEGLAWLQERAIQDPDEEVRNRTFIHLIIWRKDDEPRAWLRDCATQNEDPSIRKGAFSALVVGLGRNYWIALLGSDPRTGIAKAELERFAELEEISLEEALEQIREVEKVVGIPLPIID